MPPKCEICKRKVDPYEMVYCRYCKTPFHLECIRSHLYKNQICPHCGNRTNLAHYRRGVPEQLYKKNRINIHREHEVAPPPKRLPDVTAKKSSKSRGGKILFFINLIIVSLLIASTHYAYTNYVDYLPGLYADENTKVVIPGETAEFSVILQNTGNIVSRYNIFVDDDSVIFPAGWEVSLLDDEETYDSGIERALEPSEKYQFKVRISTTSSADANDQGAVKIIARTKDMKFASSEIFSVTTQAVLGYQFIQDDAEKYVSAGETAQFSATIENQGNTDDTYYLRLENVTLGWDAVLLHQQVTIEAGRTNQVIFTMQAPTTASGNESGEAQLKVSSQRDPDDVKSLLYTLVVNPTYAFDITGGDYAKEIIPGTSSSYRFKIRNLGNSTDTYVLNVDPALPIGWTYEVSKDTVTLAPDEQITIGLTIIVPDDALGDQTGVLNLQIESEGNQETESFDFSVTTMSEQEKYILVELFTSVTCTFCPYAEDAIEMLQQNYPGKFIILEHHLNDAFANNFTSERGIRYTIYGYPITVIDGVRKEAGGSPKTYDNYVAKIQTLLEEDPLVRIDLSVSEAVGSPGMSNVTALVKSEGLDPNTQLEIYFVTYSNGVSPQGQSSKVYNYVTVEGYKRNISSLETVENITVALEIPEDGGVVVFVQDANTNKVYQSAII